MKIKDAAIQILQEVGKPLHREELAKRIDEAGLRKSRGSNPIRSVSGCLYSDIRKHGERSSFILVSPRKFGLRKIQPIAFKEGSLISPKTTYLFLDAAEKVLDQFANRNPMSYQDITDKALAQGWLNIYNKTPEVTMNVQLVTELKRAKASGDPGRFIRTSPGLYSLSKWMGNALPSKIYKHNQQVKEKLLSQVIDFTATQFSEIIMQLLAEIGFESIKDIKFSSDSINARGTLLISDVVRIKIAVQAKRSKGRNIQKPAIQKLRGRLGMHEQGLIITTSNFSAGAIKEANQSNKNPVGLVNGKRLIALLMEYNIGVRRISHDLFELEKLPERKL